MQAPSGDIASDDRHALALALDGEGRLAEGMQMLVAEAGDRLHDADLLNDLGVLAFEAGRPQTAEAVLRTATLLAPDAAVRANLDALRGDGFCSRLIQALVVSALGPDSGTITIRSTTPTDRRARCTRLTSTSPRSCATPPIWSGCTARWPMRPRGS
jgi:hypothetical protein